MSPIIRTIDKSTQTTIEQKTINNGALYEQFHTHEKKKDGIRKKKKMKLVKYLKTKLRRP